MMDLVVMWLHGFAIACVLIFTCGEDIRSLKRKLRCWLRACPGKISSSDHGIGWMCVDCGAIKHWESWDALERQRKARQADSSKSRGAGAASD
jgi:hypothetical protein